MVGGCRNQPGTPGWQPTQLGEVIGAGVDRRLLDEQLACGAY
jgi:hypothetical protein